MITAPGAKPTRYRNHAVFMEEAHSVLLADDHPIVLNGLKALLGSRSDFQVVAACSDGQALHCLRELEPRAS